MLPGQRGHFLRNFADGCVGGEQVPRSPLEYQPCSGLDAGSSRRDHRVGIIANLQGRGSSAARFQG